MTQLRQPPALQTRLLLATGLVLLVFLGGAGYTLQRAFTKSSVQALRDRLQSYVWSYLADSDLTVGGNLIAPEIAPDPRFVRPQSGLYAGITGDKVHWHSISALGRDLPFNTILAADEVLFEGPVQTNVGGVYHLAQGVLWEVPNKPAVRLTFHVAEHSASIHRQMNSYQRELWSWLIALAGILMLTTYSVLRWSASPLRRLQNDLEKIERGDADRLPGGYLRELDGLTESFNDVIQTEREHRERYHNTLSDLAHSLKTPLAVMRSELDAGTDEKNLRNQVSSQITRMNDLVMYQLSRAATTGHQTFASALEIAPIAEDIVLSLEKVYVTKGVLCEFELEPKAAFYGERGDLQELLGNLLENAFKWANKRVLLKVEPLHTAQARRTGLRICVEDDGPGIDDDQIEKILQRGVRGDERVQGHGIGLAIVQDILKAYRGELRVSRSTQFGGASFEVRFEAG